MPSDAGPSSIQPWKAVWCVGLACLLAGCADPSPAEPASKPPAKDAMRADSGIKNATSGRSPNRVTTLHLRCTGKDYQWYWEYPGHDGQLGTEDDWQLEQHLRLPTKTDVEIELCSDDYAYTLYLPEYDLFEVAVPDRPFVVTLQTQAEGVSELLGSQMCGYTHPLLLGEVRVVSPEDFEKLRVDAQKQ